LNHSDKGRNSKVSEYTEIECAFSDALYAIAWRQMGHLRERKKAESLILLSEVGMLILVIEFEDPQNDLSPISMMTPLLSSTSAKFLQSANAPAGIIL